MRWGDIRPLIENKFITVVFVNYDTDETIVYSDVLSSDYDDYIIKSFFFTSNSYNDKIYVKCIIIGNHDE